VKFGPVLAEIFGIIIVDICRLIPKGTETPCIISGISEPIFTKIAQNVAKIVPFITSKAELRYLNPLRNASVLNSFFSQIFSKIGCHGNVPKRIRKRGPDRENSCKYLTFGEKIVKIGPVDPDIICLKLKKEETRNAWQSLANSPFGTAVSPNSK